MTGEYTNAVLAILLPLVGDYCQKLDLPCPHPLSTNHVQKAGIGYKKLGEVQGGILLTNGYSFAFDYGYIYLFSSPTSYLGNCNTAEDTPKFTGQVKVSKRDATKIIRDRLSRLELPILSDLLKRPPIIKGPVIRKDYTIPYYSFGWSDWPNFVDVEFNAEKGRIERISMGGPKFARPPPRIPDDVLQQVPNSR